MFRRSTEVRPALLPANRANDLAGEQDSDGGNQSEDSTHRPDRSIRAEPRHEALAFPRFLQKPPLANQYQAAGNNDGNPHPLILR